MGLGCCWVLGNLRLYLLRFSCLRGPAPQALGRHYSCFACLAFRRGLLSSSMLHEMEGLLHSEHIYTPSAKEQVWKEISQRPL